MQVEAGYHCSQIVTDPAGLLKDMPSDGFLTLHLVLDHVDAGLEMIKLFPGYVSRHSTISNFLGSNISMGCSARQQQLAASPLSLM
jgi:hypothetical protein